MRIGIDVRPLEWQRGGVARYLVQMLTRWPGITNEHEFVLYFQNFIPPDDFLRYPKYELRVVRGPKLLRRKRIFTEQLLMPSELSRDKLDLYYATWYSAPLVCPAPKNVVAAWDISYTTHKNDYRIMDRISLGVFSKIACKRADGVVTCSPFDARQIERYYRIPGDRICTLALAVGDQFRTAGDPARIEQLRKKYNLPERYLLSLGVIHNRRHVDVIIEAFQSISAEFPDAGLVVVGRNETVPFIDIAERMKPLADRGCHLTFVPDDELADFYAGAWYYVCFSTVDGESIMMKEAMSCGTPVVTSAMMRESVEASTPIVADPTNVYEVAATFRQALADSDQRELRAERGKAWVQQFSWQRVAEESLRFLETR